MSVERANKSSERANLHNKSINKIVYATKE
jgi:hypothetical protein